MANMEVVIPGHEAFMNPLLDALRRLGGSGTFEEIETEVAEIAGLTEEQLQVPHGETNRSQFDYRLAWTRTYLKWFGLVDNSSRGVWSLTPRGLEIERVDPREVRRAGAAMHKKVRRDDAEQQDGEVPEDASDWRDQVLSCVLHMPPPSFERLSQRILRESGFVQVEVTGRTGDGGIDGKGILRTNGLLSFHVNFQCKRWQGVVGPSVVREFRGAMMGRADKGLIITTATSLEMPYVKLLVMVPRQLIWSTDNSLWIGSRNYASASPRRWSKK
jgi:restriction system protein